MVDTKKVGARSAAKVPVAVKSAPAGAKPNVKAAKPAHRIEAPITGEPIASPSVTLAPAEIIVAKPTPAAAVEALPLPAPVAAITSVASPGASALRHAVSESVSASAYGALAVNEKVIEALQTQSEAVLELWRNSISTPHLTDLLRIQSTGARQVYETGSAQWRDIANTTAHWFAKTVEPLSSAISDFKR